MSMMNINEERMSRKNKRRFREEMLGYENSRVDNHLFAKNIIIGDVEKAKVIISAHYDTPPRLPVWFVKHLTFWGIIGVPTMFYLIMRLLFQLPVLVKWNWIYENLDLYFTATIIFIYAILLSYVLYLFGLLGNPNKVNMNDNTSGVIVVLEMVDRLQGNDDFAFVLFDNEEKGLFGSLHFRKKYGKKLKGKKIVVLDCVGVGDELILYTAGRKTGLVDDIKEMDLEVDFGIKHKRSTIMSMSDHFAFKGLNHVLMLMQYRGGKNSLAKIHTKKDTVINYDKLFQIPNILEKINT